MGLCTSGAKLAGDEIETAPMGLEEPKKSKADSRKKEKQNSTTKQEETPSTIDEVFEN
jgi:hypothetical protein